MLSPAKKTPALIPFVALALLIQVTSCEFPFQPKSPPPPIPTAQPSSSATETHSEILREMFLVVLLKEKPVPDTFSGLLNALEQGASYEGIYNGLVHSSNYRELELESPKSSERALHVFALELDALEK